MKSDRVREAARAVIKGETTKVETTGINPQHDCVVEAGCRDVPGGESLAIFDAVANSECAIPAVSSAVHQRTNADTEPRLTAIPPNLRAVSADAVIVAHDARFGLPLPAFLTDRPAVSSLRFAMHVNHDVPNYESPVSRSYVGKKPELFAQTVAHHALGDVIVTGNIFTVRIPAAALQRDLPGGGANDLDSLTIDDARSADLPKRHSHCLLRGPNVFDDPCSSVAEGLDRRRSRFA